MRAAGFKLLAVAATAIPASMAMEPPRPAPMPSPQQIVDVRRVGMRLAAADIQLMRTAAEKGADIRPMARAARGLEEWGAVLPALFPAGTGPDAVQTRARPEIWADRADFEQRARDFAMASAQLAQAAAANDMAAGQIAWDATWESCNACHARYRSEPSASR